MGWYYLLWCVLCNTCWTRNELSSLHSFVSIRSSILYALATCPFPLGTPVVILTCWIFSSWQYSSKSLLVKAVPLSVINLTGLPRTCWCICSFISASSLDVDFVGKSHVNFVNAFTVVSMWASQREKKESASLYGQNSQGSHPYLLGLGSPPVTRKEGTFLVVNKHDMQLKIMSSIFLAIFFM